jgi:predicted O-linked N-acetylglucosamine transferase (SPINDLY family)
MDIDVLFEQALGLQHGGDLGGAERLYARILEASPSNFPAHYMLGVLRLEQGRHAEALELVGGALRKMPDAVQALITHGFLLSAFGRHREALEDLDRALAIAPDNSEALQNRGQVFLALTRLGEALSDFDRALAKNPDYAQAWLGRGMALRGLNRVSEAVRAFDRALSAEPDLIEAWFQRGIVQDELGHREQAIASYDRALQLQPNNFAVINNRAATLMKMKRFAEAAAGFRRLDRLSPGNVIALNGVAGAALQACDWSFHDEYLKRMRALVLQGRPEIQPGTLMGYHDEPALQKACAANYFRSLNLPAPLAAWRTTNHKPFSGEKIKIAYCSADFQSHPVPRLLIGMFENHDREKFEVHAISFAPDDKSEMRVRLTRTFDHFHDVLTMSDSDTARLMAELGVDIAVDLMGYTTRARTGILTRRPAPVQVNYMGYPSTLAADFCDYIIGDPVVTPFDYQPFYSERIVQLPDTYMATDDKRAVPGPAPSRAEAGLPARGFVFCCFNNNWKISAPQFDIWMRLMRGIEESVLWLLRDNDEVMDNLKRHAAERGIDPGRVIFAPRVKQPEHMARHRLADLFLDTLPYNAHTTAEDCLWAGVPLVTCLGQNFYGRVAASTLHAMGVPELVTGNLAEYEKLALALAKDPPRLAALKKRLEDNRRSAPLFNTARFTRNMEKAYFMMRDVWLAGEAPRAFKTGTNPTPA